MSWADRITRTLNAESEYATLMHEELPDWLDIERRPEPKRPTPPPPPTPKPKEKKPMAPPPKLYLDTEERALVQRALAATKRSSYSVACELDLNPPQVAKWLRSGKCLAPIKATRLVAWAEDTLGEPLDEAKRAEAVARAGGSTTPRLLTREQMDDEARDRRLQIAEQSVEAFERMADDGDEVEWAKPGFNVEDFAEISDAVEAMEPYPETSTPGHACGLCGKPAWLRIDGMCESCWTPAPPPPPDPDPHQVVLCALGVAQLEYAMGQRGFHLPEGFRWVVGVERVAR